MALRVVEQGEECIGDRRRQTGRAHFAAVRGTKMVGESDEPRGNPRSGLASARAAVLWGGEHLC